MSTFSFELGLLLRNIMTVSEWFCEPFIEVKEVSRLVRNSVGCYEGLLTDISFGFN